MQFKNKSEQYEWWTEAIGKIQKHEVSIRQGCRDLGIQFWQYYEWKERVQNFVDEGEVNLSIDEAMRPPRGPKMQSRKIERMSFIEVVDTMETEVQPLVLHFKDSWKIEVPENFNLKTLDSVLKSLEAL